jgi:hypothetical protein
MTPEERETFVDAIRTWGPQAQVNMLHEEIGELMVALNKLAREKPGGGREMLSGRVTEEVEDVRIMLDQVLVIVEATDAEVRNWRDTKVERLRYRLTCSRRKAERGAEEASR